VRRIKTAVEISSVSTSRNKGEGRLAFSFFFRDQHVLERAVDHCLPAMAGRNHPRVWDAGAALGQESYTLAILFAERMGHFGFNNLRIEATDLESARVGAAINAGVYPAEDLSRLPEGIVEKYFEALEPGHLRVVEDVRRRVAYQAHDLLSFQEIGQGFLLVVCKNVMLHFDQAARVEVLKMFHRALAPGGYLATEQTQEMPVEVAPLFERAIPDGQLFRRVESGLCAA
jgi:chemotaxis protein methyltransferase CheR